MAEERIESAKQVYATLCSALDKKKWNYEKMENDEEKLAVYLPMGGEDIPMKIFIIVDAQTQIVRVMSPLPFKMSEEKRMDGVIVTGMATSVIENGCFDYDIGDGSVTFRLTSVFRGSTVSEELFYYMIGISCVTIDAFNDKFLAVDKGVLSIEDFLSSVSK